MAKKEKEQEEIKNEQTESQDCMNQETANNEDVQEEQATEETPEVAAEEEETADSDPLSKAMAEAAEWEKKFYYKSAEFENYRKRTIKEKAELILNGSEKAVTAILPVIDDMERALANAEKTDDAVALKEGMELIYKKFLKILQGMGVKTIDTADQDFDTNYHEAVAMVPGMGDDKKGKVIDCVETGYMLNDKVIRFAKVAVGQ
ncbi:MAG: nucleotide exchange factor GrpE [Prevotella sp.]|nr:nucleotide exchange factor GrpE [Prevotella sp.]